MSSQYISVEVSDSQTYAFDALTILNDLIFIYILHKVSKRLPVPYQTKSNKNEHDATLRHMNNENNNNVLPLEPINDQNSKPEEILLMQFHSNKHINKCYKCHYNLITPIYPSYYFDDITPDKRKELLESHWKTIKEQSDGNLIPNKKKSTSVSVQSVDSYNKKGIFAITAKRATALVFQKRSIWQYASLSLRLWSVICGIIALALTWSFWMNMLLEYCIACMFANGEYWVLLGLIGVFFIVHCALWWFKRQWQALRLLWYNICDDFSIKAVVLWRIINFILCLAFTLWSSINTEFTVSDSVFWQLFLRWMVVQGLIWELGYCVLSFFVNICVMYQLYLVQYNFGFLQRLGHSNLNFIKRQKRKLYSSLFPVNNKQNKTVSIPENDVLAIDTKQNDQKVDLDANNTNDGKDDTKTNEIDNDDVFDDNRVMSEEDTNKIQQYDELEITQQNLVLALQRSHSQSIHKTKCETFLTVICALKDNEDNVSKTCCNKIKMIYLKYFYVIMVYISIIVLFTVGSKISDRAMCTFAGWMFLMYYIIVLFRRGKYNALYCFWSSKYHQRFYSNLKIIHQFEQDKIAESKRNSVIDTNVVRNIDRNASIADVGGAVDSLSSDENTDYIALDDEKEEEEEKTDIKVRQIPVKRVSSTDGREILLYHDPIHNRYIDSVSINYMDFWSMIEYDDNDFYGCAVFCGATKELCSLLCALIIIIIFVALSITFSSSANSPTQSVYSEDTDSIIAPYPICQVNWAKDYLSLLDLVYLTLVAYYSDKNEIRQQFDLWFGNNLTVNGWDFNNIYIEDTKPAFFHISNDIGFEIVAIRGTYSMDDVLQDISLFTEIATLQTFSWIIPLTTILPVGFIRDFVKYASIPEGIIDPHLRDRYDQPIFDYVATNLSQSLSKKKNKHHANQNKSIILLGHSLGGGVAEIVAAKFADSGYTNVYSFGLSSPGALWSSLKFGFSVEALDKSSISVLPRRDPVSSVDKHGGVSQIIECNADEMILCHLATRSFCELYQECGLSLVRNLSFAHCVCGNATTSANNWSDCW